MKITAKEWQERAQSAETKQFTLESALHCALTGGVQWIETQKDKDGGKYKFGVSNLDAPNGGLFFTRFDFPGQKPDFTVRLLDEVLSDCRSHPASEFTRIAASAIEKAQILRYKLLNPKSEETNET